MLRAAANTIVATATGDNNESERGELLVVLNDNPARKIYRGVVEDVGARVREQEEVTVGCLIHYTDFHEVQDRHVVPVGCLLAWEGDD